MHSLFRKRGVLLAGLLALTLAALTPGTAMAKPQPGAKGRGFRLFARALGAMTINRVYCGLSSTGEVCVDSSNSSTIGGGFWPKGTADQYVFNSGLQAAGIIGADGGPWANDTTGAFFFDPKGTTQHGEQVQPIYNFSNPTDATAWPAAANVPLGDSNAVIFDNLLQGRNSASQGDIWTMAWDGNPNLNAGRKHPLGIVVEERGMGWNFPSGNEDIIYFIYTFYNISSLNAADYANIRPDTRAILLQQAATFHQQNDAKFGITVPQGGYTITNLYAAFAADMDVADAGVNYSSVNLPFALGYVYDHTFGQFTGWNFDPSIFSAPFFAGSGFVGVKYLKSPSGPGAIQLFSVTVNGAPYPGAFNDPQNAVQLYRYLSANIIPGIDPPCNEGVPTVTHICNVNNNSPQDMRFFQSSTALTLPPGGFGSIVVGYIFAAPVVTGGCNAPCDVKPGNPLLLTSVASLASGANTVDSLTGFRGYADANADNIVQQGEMKVVANSLLGKALTAQSVFDSKFLLAFAPDPPAFFLIPGDQQVTVLWRPSPTETTGDPYFSVASQALVGGVANPLYDPNYRQFDVEGYRVYRGRVDAPSSLSLLAQFDYSGTIISDYIGIVNSDADCAPELGVTTSCAGLAPNLKNGTTLVNHRDFPLVGDLRQLKAGSGRQLLATGQALVTKEDTAIEQHSVVGAGADHTCGAVGSVQLCDTGVPFVFVDRTPRDNFRYFYSVTAFDINSIESGPSSIESPRATKSVTPVRPASNFTSTGTISSHVIGRGVAMDTIITALPTLDPTTGKFSGPMPPANNSTVGFVGQFVTQVFSAPGNVDVKLTGLSLGDARNGVPVTYFFHATGSGGDTLNFSLPVQQGLGFGSTVVASAPFPAAPVDDQLAARYGIPPGLVVSGQISQGLMNYQITNAQGRGCLDGGVPSSATPRGCSYFGARWFAGANETKNDPNGGNSSSGVTANFNNAGELPNVLTINAPHADGTISDAWRRVEATQGGAVRAADFKVYWNTTNVGKIDSVVDVTHNVPVPLQRDSVSGGFGILNQVATTGAGSFDGQPGELTVEDFGCVEPFRSGSASAGSGGTMPCSSAAPYLLSDSVQLGTIAQVTGGPAVQPPSANPGFAMYLAGQFFLFEMAPGATAPVNTVWTMRSYIGVITGGNGTDGNLGAYGFTSEPRTFSAIGASLQISFTAANVLATATTADLAHVHTVPDPYYVTSEFEQSTDNKIIKFVNLPQDCFIRIYSSSGVLVTLIEHHSTTFGGEQDWNVRNRNNQVVASGVYFYHIEEPTGARKVGRMTVVNFAQ